MKKVAFIFMVLFTLAAGSSVAYVALKPKPTIQSDPVVTTPTQTTSSPAETTQAPTTGSYVNYAADIIAQTSGQKVLFFYAPWCPQCRAIDADIRAQGVPAGLTIIKVDYDSNQNLRKQYGVTIQASFVRIDDSGNKTGLFVAYNEPTFAAVKRDFLDR